MKHLLLLFAICALTCAWNTEPIPVLKAAEKPGGSATNLPPGVGQPSSSPTVTVPPWGAGNRTNSTSPQPPQQSPVYRGLNVPGHLGGQLTPFKTKDDWITSFKRIKGIPGGFNAARVYAMQDDGHAYLPDQLEAASEADINLLLGIYLGSDDPEGKRFNQEFQVLKDGLTQYGVEHVIGISVGNEDLYRGTSAPTLIAQQILIVQTWLDQNFPSNCIPVGHTDTWTMIVNASNSAVTNAADFLVANVFPYWENATIAVAPDFFAEAVQNITSLGEEEGIEVWMGETGWPMQVPAGMAFQGVPGKESVQEYWQTVICSEEFQQRHSFVYVDYDEGEPADLPQWGLFDKDGSWRIDLNCGGPV